MPSGNAIYTYIGKEPEVTIQGQSFPKDEPQHVTDNGIIAVLTGNKDFADGGVVPNTAEFAGMVAAMGREGPIKIIPAKPKGKAK